MTDTPRGPQGEPRTVADAEAETEVIPAAGSEAASAEAPRTSPLTTAWERIPKTIPHTRARTSTVVLSVLFLALMWWYLGLYAHFVPEEQRRTGQAPVTTTTTSVQEEPTYQAPVTEPTEVPSSAVASSGAPSGSGGPSATTSGAAGATGATGGANTSTTGATTTATSGGVVLPGGVTLPGLPGATTDAPTSGGAPTTTGPPS